MSFSSYTYRYLTEAVSGKTAGAGSQKLLSSGNIRNTNIFTGDIDLSGCGWFNGQFWHATLIGNRTAVLALHAFGVPTSGTCYFTNNSGTQFSCNIINGHQVGSTDICIVTFDADVDASIHRNKILPPNWRDYVDPAPLGIYVRQSGYVYIGEISYKSDTGEHDVDFTSRISPFTSFGWLNDASANPAAPSPYDYANLITLPNGDPLRVWIDAEAVPGDSSSPAGTIVNGEFVFMCAIHYYSLSGPMISDFYDEVVSLSGDSSITFTDMTEFNVGGGKYNVYLSPWNGTPEEIDFTTIAYTTSDNPIMFPWFTGSVNKTGTIYIVVRQEENGVEEKNFNYMQLTLVNGILTNNLLAPTQLQYELLDDKLILKFTNNATNVTSFNVYKNGVLLDNVDWNGSNEIHIDLEFAEADYKVSAVYEGIESGYSNTVTVGENSYTDIEYGYSYKTWRDN